MKVNTVMRVPDSWAASIEGLLLLCRYNPEAGAKVLRELARVRDDIRAAGAPKTAGPES